MNPDSGRFLTTDTFEGNNYDPQSLHKYLYVTANPVNQIDPEGHSNLPEVGIVQAITNFLSSTFVSAGRIVVQAARFAFQVAGQVARWVFLQLKNWVSFLRDSGGVLKEGAKGVWEVINNDAPNGFIKWLDTEVHESFHLLVRKILPNFIEWGENLRFVGPSFRYLEEIFAYTFGHAATFRIFALPLVTIEAYLSVMAAYPANIAIFAAPLAIAATSAVWYKFGEWVQDQVHGANLIP